MTGLRNGLETYHHDTQGVMPWAGMIYPYRAMEWSLKLRPTDSLPGNFIRNGACDDKIFVMRNEKYAKQQRGTVCGVKDSNSSVHAMDGDKGRSGTNNKPARPHITNHIKPWPSRRRLPCSKP